MSVEADVKSESDISDAMDDNHRNRRDEDGWRTRLCPRGQQCTEQYCLHAHRLSELRPPIESEVLHPELWQAGIGRFYGQFMSDEVLRIFQEYYENTLEYECPLWAHALVFSCSERHLVPDLHFPWDFGLTMDVRDLRRGRVGGGRPFEFLPGLWELLETRERDLALEQDYS